MATLLSVNVGLRGTPLLSFESDGFTIAILFGRVSPVAGLLIHCLSVYPLL
jgi:hypothetical protein